MSSELRPGYIKTDLGVIPESWRVRSLGDVVDFLDGRRRPVKDSDRAKMRGDIPYYGASGIVDYVNDYLFDDDLILLGEDGENILSRNCKLAFRVSGKIWVNNHAHVLKPKDRNDIGFIAEFLESLNYDQYNTGTAQPKLNKQVCSAIQVLTPPLREQRAIAAALSDVDALLAKLDALIAKKRDLKQAAMQQLLTGQTRLPGFGGTAGYLQTDVGLIPEDWEVRTFRDICMKIQDGTHFSPTPGGNDYLYITSKNIGYGALDVTSADRISANEHESIYGRCDVKRGDLLLTKDGANTGNAAINTLEEPFSLLSSVAFLRFDCRLHSAQFFLYQILSESGQRRIKLEMSGNAITRLTLTKINALRVPVASITEQTAIATILSDMDAEITALEARRDKTRDLKQGMMQELLTGRIRLV